MEVHAAGLLSQLPFPRSLSGSNGPNRVSFLSPRELYLSAGRRDPRLPEEQPSTSVGNPLGPRPRLPRRQSPCRVAGVLFLRVGRVDFGFFRGVDLSSEPQDCYFSLFLLPPSHQPAVLILG